MSDDSSRDRGGCPREKWADNGGEEAPFRDEGYAVAIGDEHEAAADDRPSPPPSPSPTASLSSSSDEGPAWPEDSRSRGLRRVLTSVNDALFYSYMNRILSKGADLHRRRRRRQRAAASATKASRIPSTEPEEGLGEDGELSSRDLYRAPSNMEANHLRAEFDRLFEEESEKAASSSSFSSASNSKGGKAGAKADAAAVMSTAFDRSSFLRVLWGLASPTYVPAGYWQLVATLSQCSIPLLVREVLLRLEANPGRSFVSEGLPVAIGLFAVSMLDAVAMERQKFLSFRSGIALRSAIVNAVYDRVLRLSPAGRAGLTSGEVTNLVAIDAQKLFELVQEGHQSWSCPLAMCIVTALLLVELGPCILVGMASMFLLVPLVQRVVRLMMKIRRRRVAVTDRRVEATTAMLQGIKFTKLNHYEDKFRDRVMEARRDEMKLLRRELSVLAVTFFLTVISPVFASALTFATYVLLDDGNVLTASTTFTTLFLFAALRFPINYAGKLMGKAAQGIQACQRFATFFSRECRSSDDEKRSYDDDDDGSGQRKKVAINVPSDAKNGNGDAVLEVTNATFAVGGMPDNEGGGFEDKEKLIKASFTVSNITVSVKRGEILCVVGPVASGKTTFINGLIGDLSPSSGSVDVRGRVAYAGQTPFILNATLRENVLFGSPYNEARYENVLDACCLLPDLEQIGPAGDLTEIGERGVTLSGGQKQRVSLARTVYASPDVAVFDDPLSALDAATGKRVFERLFKSPDADLLGEAAVVLVTHASHFLHRVEGILVLVNGRAAYTGSWEGLASCAPAADAERAAIEAILSAVQEEDSKEEEEAKKKRSGGGRRSSVNGKSGADSAGELMTVEEREYGLSDWRTWTRWFKHAGGGLFAFVVVVGMGLDRFFYVALEWWLASWTSGASEPIERFGRMFPPQTEGQSAQYQYLAVYAIIFVISCGAAIFRTQFIIQGGARSSKKLFALMTSRVLRAPMWYFETTPLGRILSRFTYDTEVCDQTLTQTMTMLMTSLGWFFTGIILQSIILPWQIFALGFILIVYLLVLMRYRKSAVDLQRLDAVSRSPVQAQLAEAIDGTSTIRVFGKAPHFSDLFRSALDSNSSAMMNFMAAHRWMSVRIQLVGATAVLFSVCFVVAFNDVLQIEPGIAGMLIIWSANFTISLGFMVQGISESEAAMTSVERVTEMTTLPQESDAETSAAVYLPSTWPASGSLEFSDVRLRYRPGLPFSLNGLTFSLRSGQRCGVVGRTGAGKSTLTAALFRLVEIESGKIALDGMDLSTVGLANVRGRKNGMSIIPQDPVLYSGTLRECLDPFGDVSDDNILDALRAVRVGDAAVRGRDALEDYVEEGGRNYSVGERQLLCLARAILAKPKVLVLDEATASVDGETDAFIQRMLRTRFDGTTLLTIAHRLHTVMDYDVILSMDDGYAVEFGSPRDLLAKEDGLFSSLVDSTGKESSAALRAAALV